MALGVVYGMCGGYRSQEERRLRDLGMIRKRSCEVVGVRKQGRGSRDLP